MSRPLAERSIFGERIYTCGACGLLHEAVECGGIYYCPNPLCWGAGGHNHRIPYTTSEGTNIQAWLLGSLGGPYEAAIEAARDASLVALAVRYEVGEPTIEARIRALVGEIEPGPTLLEQARAAAPKARGHSSQELAVLLDWVREQR